MVVSSSDAAFRVSGLSSPLRSGTKWLIPVAARCLFGAAAGLKHEGIGSLLKGNCRIFQGTNAAPEMIFIILQIFAS
ncbi:hypothetical protein SAMN05877831_104124 [Rhodobacter maris]|uniref:Uncharacterized protein n=1 Tax=Rhodobacter maris TaxID=446682 RepID=A0A285SBX8_9RHOB|nr:hypothetical protein SAMN05877831_104124 [Rhodobacter maris]